MLQSYKMRRHQYHTEFMKMRSEALRHIGKLVLREKETAYSVGFI